MQRSKSQDRHICVDDVKGRTIVTSAPIGVYDYCTHKTMKQREKAYGLYKNSNV